MHNKMTANFTICDYFALGFVNEFKRITSERQQIFVINTCSNRGHDYGSCSNDVYGFFFTGEIN